MAFKLRDKQRTATKRGLLCLSLIVLAYLLIATTAYATTKKSLGLTDNAVFPDGEPTNLSKAYDKWSNYDAKGWKYVSSETNDDLDTWNSEDSPHGNYSANSNKCRVCHGLHQANRDSFRILFNDSRKTECDRCHDPVTGLSGKKPYRMFSDYQQTRGDIDYSGENSGKAPEQVRIVNGKKIILRDQDIELINQKIDEQNKTIGVQGKEIERIGEDDININLINDITPVLDAKGEHSIGARVIPDSNIQTPSIFEADGLVCYACHDPHFAPQKTIRNIPRWKKRGLLKDPGENGGSADDGMISVQPYDAQNKPIESASANPSVGEIKSAFCADCHNKNPSWDSGAVDHDNRPNQHAHPIGNVDGMVNVYGKRQKIANDWAVTQISEKGCLGCHAATTETDDAGNKTGISSFPHQSKGHKLLFDDYTTESTVLAAGNFSGYTGDPNRPLPGLDVGDTSFIGPNGTVYMPGVCRRCHTNVAEDSANGF